MLNKLVRNFVAKKICKVLPKHLTCHVSERGVLVIRKGEEIVDAIILPIKKPLLNVLQIVYSSINGEEYMSC